MSLFTRLVDRSLNRLYLSLRERKFKEFNRTLSYGDYFTDRWDRARFHGFGEGTTVYDSVLIIGNVQVGRNTWIGPGVVLDGSGGELKIGDYVSISAGVQIYTHRTVNWSISLGKLPYDGGPVAIGSGVYIGPNSVISMGVTIGDKSVVGAMSFVNKSIPPGVKAWGSPAKVQIAADLPPAGQA